MAVDSIQTRIQREPQLKPELDQQDLVDQLKHGNIYEVLKTPGVNRRDIEDYLAQQHKNFQNEIVQDYEIYAGTGMIPEPTVDTVAPVNAGMVFSEDDRGLMQREFKALAQVVDLEDSDAVVEKGGVSGIAEKALREWESFFDDLSLKVIDNQMMSEIRSKSAEINRETQRLIAMAAAGQIEPEFILIALAKSNMMQNGTLFTNKGKKITAINEQMNRIADDLYKMNPNDNGYLKELQKSQAITRDKGQNLQIEMMDIQKLTQNISTTLEWVNNAIRMFRDMRQTPTRNIGGR